jgi:hypothetical protein
MSCRRRSPNWPARSSIGKRRKAHRGFPFSCGLFGRPHAPRPQAPRGLGSWGGGRGGISRVSSPAERIHTPGVTYRLTLVRPHFPRRRVWGRGQGAERCRRTVPPQPPRGYRGILIGRGVFRQETLARFAAFDYTA